MKCERCGNIIDDESTFCPKCGAKLMKSVDKDINYNQGKYAILFNTICIEYGQNSLKSIETKDRLLTKAKVLDIDQSILEKCIKDFLNKVEKLNAYIKVLWDESADGELSEDQEEELCLYAAEYGFNEKQTEIILEHWLDLRRFKFVNQLRKEREEELTKFDNIIIPIHNLKIVLPGINAVIPELYESVVKIENSFHYFEQRLKREKNLDPGSLTNLLKNCMLSSVTQFYRIIESNHMMREQDIMNEEDFVSGMFEGKFNNWSDKDDVYNHRKEKIEEFCEKYKQYIENIINIFWTGDYVGMEECVCNYKRVNEKVILIREDKETTSDDKVDAVLNVIKEGAYWSQIYIYLSELLGLEECEEIAFLEKMKKYIIGGERTDFGIRKYLNTKYKLDDRRSVADIILTHNEASPYKEGEKNIYGSDEECEHVKKEKQKMIDLYENIDYSEESSIIDSLNGVKRIYGKLGLGRALVDDIEKQYRELKTVYDISIVNGERDKFENGQAHVYGSLDEAQKIRIEKDKITYYYTNLPYMKEAEIQEALKQIEEFYQRTKLGGEIRKETNNYYNNLCSVTDIEIDENGKIQDGSKKVFSDIEEAKVAGEKKKNAINAYNSINYENDESVIEVYNKISKIFEETDLCKAFIDALEEKYQEIDERLRTYKGTVYETIEEKEKAIEIEKRTVNGVVYNTEEEAEDVKKRSSDGKVFESVEDKEIYVRERQRYNNMRNAILNSENAFESKVRLFDIAVKEGWKSQDVRKEIEELSEEIKNEYWMTMNKTEKSGIAKRCFSGAIKQSIFTLIKIFAGLFLIAYLGWIGIVIDLFLLMSIFINFKEIFVEMKKDTNFNNQIRSEKEQVSRLIERRERGLKLRNSNIYLDNVRIAYKKCTNCGALSYENAKFCGRCGAKL